MKTSVAGRNALMGREGVRLHAYKDTKGIWTIGVGHTTAAGVPRVVRGLTISAKECDEIFARDLRAFEDTVNACVTVAVTQNEFDALVSLTFNIGQAAFRRSTVVRELNRGNHILAANAILMWNKPPEIRKRRMGERRQFLTPDNLT